MTNVDRASYAERVRTLGAFKHRGSATRQERRAARYLASELRRIGFDTRLESFKGCTSLGGRLLVHVAAAAIGIGFLSCLPIVTAAIAAIAVMSLWVEQMTRSLWLSRPLLRFDSFNIIAHLANALPITRRIVLCAHYDTQRTGIIWRVLARLAPLQWRLPVALKPPLIALGLVMASQVFVGVTAPWLDEDFVLAAAWFLFLVYLLFAALLGEWSFGAFVPGVADNASGAAGVVALAENWGREPIAGTELVVLLTGCAESGLLGVAAWADLHRTELQAVPTCFLNIDGIGFGPPRFFGWEVPVFGRPLPYPRQMTAVARSIATECKLTDAGPHALAGPTDGLALLARGLPGITVVGFEPGGRLPNFHCPTDTWDVMNADDAWNGVQFAAALLRRLAMD